MKTPPIPEATIQQTVREFLELDGWRAIRTDPVSDRSRGKGFGELGMPDYLFIRYEATKVHVCGSRTRPYLAWPDLYRPWAEVLWIEFKRKGLLPSPHQTAWIAKEQARGALVMVVDDIDGFTVAYRNSGLCLRILR
jgi:hypothetical protein